MGGRKGKAMGFQVGNVSKSVTESGGKKELKLCWLDMKDYDDLDEDDYKGVFNYWMNNSSCNNNNWKQQRPIPLAQCGKILTNVKVRQRRTTRKC